MKDIDPSVTEHWGTVSEDPFKREDEWKYQEKVYFFVLRRASGVTSQKTMFQLMSRRFNRYGDAEDWVRFLQSEEKREKKRRKSKFSIVAIPEEMEVLS